MLQSQMQAQPDHLQLARSSGELDFGVLSSENASLCGRTVSQGMEMPPAVDHFLRTAFGDGWSIRRLGDTDDSMKVFNVTFPSKSSVYQQCASLPLNKEKEYFMIGMDADSLDLVGPSVGKWFWNAFRPPKVIEVPDDEEKWTSPSFHPSCRTAHSATICPLGDK